MPVYTEIRYSPNAVTVIAVIVIMEQMKISLRFYAVTHTKFSSIYNQIISVLRFSQTRKRTVSDGFVKKNCQLRLGFGFPTKAL